MENQANEKMGGRRSLCGAVEMNLTSNHEVSGSIPGLAQWAGALMCHELWCRLVASALIPPLAWEPPYDASAALKCKKQNKTTNPPKKPPQNGGNSYLQG